MKTKKTKSNSMSHRTPADMHADGVYFSEYLLAQKEYREKQLKQLKNHKDN